MPRSPVKQALYELARTCIRSRGAEARKRDCEARENAHTDPLRSAARCATRQLHDQRSTLKCQEGCGAGRSWIQARG